MNKAHFLFSFILIIFSSINSYPQSTDMQQNKNSQISNTGIAVGDFSIKGYEGHEKILYANEHAIVVGVDNSAFVLLAYESFDFLTDNFLQLPHDVLNVKMIYILNGKLTEEGKIVSTKYLPFWLTKFKSVEHLCLNSW